MIAQPYITVITTALRAPIQKEIAMKIVATALVALSLLTGIAASANAFDAKSFYEQQDRASS